MLPRAIILTALVTVLAVPAGAPAQTAGRVECGWIDPATGNYVIGGTSVPEGATGGCRIIGDLPPVAAPVKTKVKLSVSKPKPGKATTVKATVIPAVPQKQIPGQVEVRIQKAVNGKWVTAEKYYSMARYPVNIKRDLQPAKWRVVVLYKGAPASATGQAPLKASKATSNRFRTR
jgi:hypothetical protein